MHVFILDAGFILSIGEIETPVTTIFNPPMTANRIGESLHTHCETADGIANLNRLFPVAKALRHHHANRLQTCPQFEPRQAPRHRHLNGASRLVTSKPRLLGHMPTSRHSREVIRALLIDLLDDRLMQRLMVSFKAQHILDYQPSSKLRWPCLPTKAPSCPAPSGWRTTRPSRAHRRGPPCFDRLLSIRNDVGLLSEGVCPPDGSPAGQLPAGLLPCLAVQHGAQTRPRRASSARPGARSGGCLTLLRGALLL